MHGVPLYGTTPRSLYNYSSPNPGCTDNPRGVNMRRVYQPLSMGGSPICPTLYTHNAYLAWQRRQADEAYPLALSVAWENLSPVNLEATSAPRTPT